MTISQGDPPDTEPNVSEKQLAAKRRTLYRRQCMKKAHVPYNAYIGKVVETDGGAQVFYTASLFIPAKDIEEGLQTWLSMQ